MNQTEMIVETYSLLNVIQVKKINDHFDKLGYHLFSRLL